MSDEPTVQVQDSLPAPPGLEDSLAQAGDGPADDAEPQETPDFAAVMDEQQVRLTAQDRELRELRGELEGLRQQSALAVSKYRDTLLALHTDVPATLVQGQSLEEVEGSLAAAREAVTAARQQLQEQASATRVPAGAPVWGAPDLSSLSPQQKIVLGLRQRAS